MASGMDKEFRLMPLYCRTHKILCYNKSDCHNNEYCIFVENIRRVRSTDIFNHLPPDNKYLEKFCAKLKASGYTVSAFLDLILNFGKDFEDNPETEFENAVVYEFIRNLYKDLPDFRDYAFNEALKSLNVYNRALYLIENYQRPEYIIEDFISYENEYDKPYNPEIYNGFVRDLSNEEQMYYFSEISKICIEINEYMTAFIDCIEEGMLENTYIIFEYN